MARNITVIPAKSRNGLRKKNSAEKKLKVAAYCRVSTDQEDQLHSFDAQVEYYTRYIKEHPNYELAGIYADEGISGTNTKKREQFKRMISDCESGKIDMVITKSISRFARNTQDCLQYSRKLKNLGIGILFEKEHISTLDSSGELLFTILSSLAQDESRNISENCKWGIRSKFKNGEMHINTHKFLGYDKVDGQLVINDREAKIVRRIYQEFLWGRSPREIAKGLEDEGVVGCMGAHKWYPSTVVNILKNEKHMGDALLQKSYTADFLTKKQVKNHGEVTQVYVKDSHKGIIDKETWKAVQLEFSRREAFVQEHGLSGYGYGRECNPFTSRIFCGECGSSYTRHTWKNRGIMQWQCKNHMTNGKVTCTNGFVSQYDLERGFVKAYNALMNRKDILVSKWKKTIRNGNELEIIRAKQFLALCEQPILECFVPELAQLVIQMILVQGAKKYEFTFMDGSKENVWV